MSFVSFVSKFYVGECFYVCDDDGNYSFVRRNMIPSCFTSNNCIVVKVGSKCGLVCLFVSFSEI